MTGPATPVPAGGPTGVYGLRLLRDPAFQRRAIVLLLVVVLGFRAIQFVVFTTQIQWGYDFAYYWRAAGALLHGLPIYSAEQLAGPYAPQGQNGFLYPPPLAAAVMPLAALFPDDYRVAAWVWAIFGATIVAAVVIAVGGREGLFDPSRFGGLLGERRRLIAVAVAFTLPPVVGELVLGNVHLILLGLIGLAWLGIRADTDRGERVAGLAIGLATIIKIFPALLIVWFVLTGRTRAVAWSFVGIIGMATLSLPLTGLQPWLDYPTVLANLSAPADPTDTLAPTVWLAPALGFTLARVVVTASALIVVAWAAAHRPAPIAFAATVVVSVLIAPALYHHYLAIMILPFVLAIAHVRSRGAWVVAAYLLLWGGTQPALGEAAWIVNRAMPTAGALLLMAILLVGSRTDRASTVA